MRGSIVKILVFALTLVVAAPMCFAKTAEDERLTADKQLGPMYLGRSLNYWLRSIRDRDPETMDMAFDAIRELGPAARPAVPELMRIMQEPFAPIDLTFDGPNVILSKVRGIQLRSDAVDALAAIGDGAAPAATVLIEWALAPRVLPSRTPGILTDKIFVDLVAMDVLERMRVAGSVAQLGTEAGPVVKQLLQSADGERRKLGVAILSEGAIPIAADLLKSYNCDDRRLGIAILTDMWPVVPREHLTELKNMLTCQDAN